MRAATAPFHPARILEHLLRIHDTGRFEEDDQVVVGVGKAEDLVPPVPVQRAGAS